MYVSFSLIIVVLPLMVGAAGGVTAQAVGGVSALLFANRSLPPQH
jgi:hypothetical protein